MKTIPFAKMVGAGNDFIVIDHCRNLNLKKLAVAMCSRTTGIGADGLLILDKSQKADYRMRIMNADGSEAEMCGNGARCLAAYILKTTSAKKKEINLETLAGLVSAKVNGKLIQIHLSRPQQYQPDIPLTVHGQQIKVSYIDTGVPHTIVYVDGLDNIEVATIGRTIRWHTKFAPRGTNVDFVEQLKDHLIKVRTFERGVEAETRACGTGGVASAIVTYLKAHPNIKTKKDARMNVLTASKEILKITFDIRHGEITHVRLTGTAKFIARGQYYV